MHLILGILGAFSAGFFIYREALGFIPYEWGAMDADREFQPFRETLAGFLAFGTTFLAARILGDVASLRGDITTLCDDRVAMMAELKSLQEKLQRSLDDLSELEAEFEAIEEKHLIELRVLNDNALRLRSLIPASVIQEDDRQSQERAKSLPKVYRS